MPQRQYSPFIGQILSKQSKLDPKQNFIKKKNKEEEKERVRKGAGRKKGRKLLKLRSKDLFFWLPKSLPKNIKFQYFYFFMFLTKTLVYWNYLSAIPPPNPTSGSIIQDLEFEKCNKRVQVAVEISLLLRVQIHQRLQLVKVSGSDISLPSPASRLETAHTRGVGVCKADLPALDIASHREREKGPHLRPWIDVLQTIRKPAAFQPEPRATSARRRVRGRAKGHRARFRKIIFHGNHEWRRVFSPSRWDLSHISTLASPESGSTSHSTAIVLWEEHI